MESDFSFENAISKKAKAHTVKDIVELARHSPNKLTFGSVGVGTPQHLGGELFKLMLEST